MKEIKFRAWDKHSKKMLEIIQINFIDKYLDYSDINSETLVTDSKDNILALGLNLSII